MKYVKPSITKFAAAAAALIALALVASRQLYLFAASRSWDGLLDAQGGRYHLWLAAGAALLASAAAGLMFLFYLGAGRSEPSGVAAPGEVKSKVNSPARAEFDAVSWGQLNGWCVAGQADDRRPMSGSIAKGAGSASAQRAAARLTRQGLHRVWAQGRRD